MFTHFKIALGSDLFMVEVLPFGEDLEKGPRGAVQILQILSRKVEPDWRGLNFFC